MLVIIGGPLLIGIFMTIASSRLRRLLRTEQQFSHEVAHKNWGKEQVR